MSQADRQAPSSAPRPDERRAGVFGADPARRMFARFVCVVVAALGWVNIAILGKSLLAKSPPEAGFDLQLLLDAGRRVSLGGSPYDPNAVAGGLQARDLFYSYPPLVAQVLAPFSTLPTWLILTVWCIGATAGLAAVASLLARSPVGQPAVVQSALSLDVALLTLAAAPFFFPFVVAVLFGNMDVWFPLLFGAVALTLATGRATPSGAASAGSGAALAIASAVKLHPGTLVVWLALGRPVTPGARRARVTVIVTAVAIGAAILALSLLVGGLGPWRQYVDYLRIGGNAVFASRVNIGPASQLAILAGNPGLANSLALVFAVTAIAATVVAARVVHDPLESFAWAVVASLVVLPVTWYHYPVALMPVALAAWTRSRGTHLGRRVTALLVAAYLVADVAIVLPVTLWLAVVLLFAAVRWSRARSGPNLATPAETASNPEAETSALAAVPG